MANVLAKKKIKESTGDTILNVVTAIILIAVIIIVGYPVLYVISCSFSSSSALEAGRVVLWPVDFTMQAYDFVMQYKQVWVGFRNSVFYTVCDVFLQMTMTLLVAYPLSRSTFQGRGIYTMIFYMSTRISAGMIPGFILKCDLGLFDNIWAVLISGSVSVGHILIMRTAIRSNIPGELFDAAMIDGANHFQVMMQVALPQCKGIVAVVVLYSVVFQWNSWFQAMVYLPNARQWWPLQLYIREFVANNTAFLMSSNPDYSRYLIQFCLIVVATLPILVAFPFFLNTIEKGALTGGVKE